MPTSRGIFTFPDGSRYEGGFRNGELYNGKSVLMVGSRRRGGVGSKERQMQRLRTPQQQQRPGNQGA